MGGVEERQSDERLLAVSSGRRKAEAAVQTVDGAGPHRRRAVKAEIPGHVDEARGVLRPFEVAANPIQCVGNAG